MRDTDAGRQAGTLQVSVQLWLLSDGAPGHLSQSQGIVDALASRADVRVTTIDLRVRSTFWKRLGRLLLPWIRQPQAWLARVYDIDVPPGSPRLIVSSGANTLLANALLARQTGAANVYSGTLRGYAASAYRCVFTVVPLGVANNHVLPLPPVPGHLAKAMPAPESTDRLIAVLVGGDGAGYGFTAADWKRLALSLAQLADRHQARLLVTTSRRTGVQAESVLREHLPSAVLADAVWWSVAPRKVVRDFLAASVGVVVTEDSLTMVAESIYSARPVIAVFPPAASPNSNDAAALAAYVDRQLLARCSAAALADASFPARATALPDVQAEIASVLLPLLPGAWQ
jgi:uncharacterized protein